MPLSEKQFPKGYAFLVIILSEVILVQLLRYAIIPPPAVSTKHNAIRLTMIGSISKCFVIEEHHPVAALRSGLESQAHPLKVQVLQIERNQLIPPDTCFKK